MSKKIFLITLIFISFLIVGCSYKQTDSQQSTSSAQLSSNATDEARKNTNTPVASTNINNKTANTSQKPQNLNSKNWTGNFEKGNSDSAGEYGLITITNSNDKQFDFSFFASYSTKIKGEDGKDYLNAHMGQIDGTAYFTSPIEAYYTTKDYPDYKMIFKLNNNTITVTELNTKTKKDYGMSPDAGVNVRFSGEYTVEKIAKN